jgi:hypothetical protein
MAWLVDSLAGWSAGWLAFHGFLACNDAKQIVGIIPTTIAHARMDADVASCTQCSKVERDHVESPVCFTKH